MKDHEKMGIHSAKNLEDAKLLLISLAIGGTGLLLGLVFELFTH